ncbi:hypothetical protein Tco_0471277, partial [Tanacetum coccineum]
LHVMDPHMHELDLAIGEVWMIEVDLDDGDSVDLHFNQGDYEVLAWMGMVRGYQGSGLGEYFTFDKMLWGN